MGIYCVRNVGNGRTLVGRSIEARRSSTDTDRTREAYAIRLAYGDAPAGLATIDLHLFLEDRRPMTTDQQRKDRLTRFLQDVWTNGDVDAARDYLGPAYTIHHDPGDLWHGRTLDLDEYTNRARISRAPFPDQSFELRELFAEHEAVVATWLWTGTHLGDMAGFPASGRKITMSGATVYYFEDDRIIGHWQVTDRLGVFQQLRSPA